jgi:cytidylate kinase
MSLILTERLIQRQLNHWNRMRAYLRDKEPGPEPRRGPVITISRQAGSGGRLLARAVADKLDLELQDQSLVSRIAEDKRLQQSLVAQLDERTVSQVRLWVQGVLHRRLFLRDDYHTALVEVITSLAARGGVVFLGRGANLILGERADLRVRVVASAQNRLERLRERTGLSRAEARTVMAETDAQRSGFIREVFRTEPGLAENFDLVLNADRLDNEAMLDQVLLALTRTGSLAESTLQARV